MKAKKALANAEYWNIETFLHSNLLIKVSHFFHRICIDFSQNLRRKNFKSFINIPICKTKTKTKTLANSWWAKTKSSENKVEESQKGYTIARKKRDWENKSSAKEKRRKRTIANKSTIFIVTIIVAVALAAAVNIQRTKIDAFRVNKIFRLAKLFGKRIDNTFMCVCVHNI